MIEILGCQGKYINLYAPETPMRRRSYMITSGLYGWKTLQFQIKERELAISTQDEAIVKVLACGICGTDLHFVRHMKNPKGLGHEIAAEVIETGSAIHHCKPGDTVIVEDCTSCGVCYNCKNGDTHLCRNMTTIEGSPGIATYMKVSGRALVPYQNLTPIQACMTEPSTVALNVVLGAQIPLGADVAVIGCGPLGLLSALLAKHLGAGKVAMVGRSNSSAGIARLSMAERIGADMVVDSSNVNPVQAILSQFPDGIERIIVSTPPTSIPEAIAMASYGATITFFGIDISQRQDVPIDINDLIFRKISLQPYLGEPAVRFPSSLDLIKRKIIPTDLLVTHTTSIEEAPKLFAQIVHGAIPIVKGVCIP